MGFKTFVLEMARARARICSCLAHIFKVLSTASDFAMLMEAAGVDRVLSVGAQKLPDSVPKSYLILTVVCTTGSGGAGGDLGGWVVSISMRS